MTFFKRAKLVLFVTEPMLLLERIRKNRKYRCSDAFRLGSNNLRLNARTAYIDEKWILGFGVNCPSDFQALKRYHIRNVLVKLLVDKYKLYLVDLDIKDEQRSGVSRLCHDLSIIRNIANRVIVIRKGEIVEEGKAKHVLSNPEDSYTKTLVEAIPTVSKKLLNGGQIVK